MEYGTAMEKNRKADFQILPSKRQFIVLIPFAVIYMLFIIMGDLEKASELGAARNIGRIVLWTIVSYGILLLLCILISGRRALAACLPEKLRLPEQRRRQGKWYVFWLFFLICLLCYLPFF